MERIIVPFEGPGPGFGALTWGQQQVWRAMVEVDSSMSIGGAVPVDDGRTVDDFVAELRFLLSQFPSLRTRLVFEEPWHETSVDACSLVRQRVHGCGEAVLEVYEAGPDDDPAELAAAVLAAWRARKFDYTGEWPIREAVVRRGETVTHVIVLVCHLAADGGALSTMIRQLGERDAAGAAAGSYTSMHPLELVEAQSAAGRTTDNAMRHWETQLRAISPRRFTTELDRGEPRWRQIVWQSTALLLAAERLAAQLSTDLAPVFLAAYAAAFGAVTGEPGPFATQVIVSNRFRPGLADVVSPLAQNGLVVLDVTGVDVAEAVRRARLASMSASKYSYYEPDARLALLERIGRERGEPIDLAVFYNDRRVGILAPNGGPEKPATDEQIRTAQSLTGPVSERALPYFNEKLMINIDDVPGTVQVTVEVDTRCLSVPDLHRLLSAMEQFVVHAAVGETPV